MRLLPATLILLCTAAYCFAAVGFDKDGFLTVDGAPYFPVGMYTIQSRGKDHDAYMKEAHEAGFNTTVFYALTTETVTPLLDAAGRNGLKAFVYPTMPFSLRKGTETTDSITKDIQDKMNHPALLGWYLVDEPEGIGKADPRKTLELYQLVKKIDPSHPCSLVIMSPKAASNFKDCADVIWTDPYPIPSKPASIIGPHTTACLNAIAPKPLWVVPQAFDQSVWRTGKVKEIHRPTPEEEHCMTYLALVHGAKGILFWAHTASKYYIRDYPDHWEAMKKIAGELKLLTPVLLTPNSKIQVAVEGSGIDWMLKEMSGALYLLAVNKDPKPTAVSFTLPDVDKFQAEELFQSRRLAIEDGSIKDEFKPLEVHVYKLTKP